MISTADNPASCAVEAFFPALSAFITMFADFCHKQTRKIGCKMPDCKNDKYFDGGESDFYSKLQLEE
jgi:hypothetical protein